MYIVIEFVVIVFFAPLKPEEERLGLIEKYKESAKTIDMIDCGDSASAKNRNRAEKAMRRIARSIENNFCNMKDDFALLLDIKEDHVCVWAARHMLEVMEYDPDTQRRAIDVLEHVAGGDYKDARTHQLWLDNWYSKNPNMKK